MNDFVHSFKGTALPVLKWNYCMDKPKNYERTKIDIKQLLKQVCTLDIKT